MNDNLFFFLLVIVLGIILLLAAGHIRELQRQLADAHRQLDDAFDQIKYWHCIATGGAFADFINSLNLDRWEHKR